MWIYLIDTLAHLSDGATLLSWLDVTGLDLSGLDLGQGLAWQSLSHSHMDLLAQQFDTDVFRGAREAFSNFFQSGQVWALLIGFILGYMLRGMTTYS